MHRRSKVKWLSFLPASIIRAVSFSSAYVFLPAMMLLMSLDPLLRYVVGSPFFWSNEVTTFLMILVVFTSFAIALLEGRHIRVTLISNLLPQKLQNALWVLVSLAGVSYGLFLFFSVLQATLSSLEYWVRTGTSEMLIFPWQIVILFGLLAFLVAAVIILVQRARVAFGLGEESVLEEKMYG